jgi:hypothetical protein
MIIQLLVETDHFMFYGHIPDTLTMCMKSVSGKKKMHLKHELEHRLKAFDWPIGWSPFAAGFNILRTTNSNHSMEAFRRLGTVCIHIFNGISLFSLSLLYRTDTFRYPSDIFECQRYRFVSERHL